MIAVAFVSVSRIQAQNLKPEQVEKMLDTKHFSFEPLTMIPQSGGTKQLTHGFSLKISGDSLNCYLPYFGQAYSASIGTNDAGFNFTSNQFDYSVVPKKKDSYQITIKVNNKTSNPIFNITVYNNGTAYVQANSNDKQTISYNGYLKQ